ncbi:MAG: LamG domain-containing protein [Crocinitomicaceae bacterium]|nr:LamG domain-containing protein [Crocinitomicaceae bacterium]
MEQLHFDGSTALNDGNWHLITGTFDGTTAKLYADGVLVNSSAFTIISMPINAATIGDDISGEPFFGKIDDVGVWNTALNSGLILNLYNGCTSSYCSFSLPLNFTYSASGDTINCSDNNGTLTVVVDDPPQFQSILWSSGETTTYNYK